MVNEIIFKTRVDTGNSVNDLKAVNEQLKQVDQSTEKIGTDSAGQLEQLNKKIAAGGMSARELSRAIKEYMTIAIQAGTETPVGKEAIANASQLKDDLRGLGEEVSRLKDGAAGMQAALQLGGTIVAGYSVAQGSLAMFGVESEKLMETMVKLQSATAVLTGIQQIHANLEKESFLMLRAKAVETKVLTALTAAYSVAVGSSTGALKLFRLALIATGIGAIVVALGLLIANFDKVTGAVKSVSNWFSNLGEKTKLVLSILFPFIGAIRLVTAALEKLGIIDSEEAEQATRMASAKQKALQEETAARRKMVDEALADNKRMQESINSNYDFEIAKAKAAGKDTYNLEREKRAEMRKTLEAQILILEESLKLNSNSATAMMQIIKDMAAVRSAITESEQQEEISAIQRSTDNRKKGAERRKEIEKKQEEETAKSLERERLLRDYFIASIDDENVQKLTKLEEAHKREREELVKKYGEDTELIEQLESKQTLELSALKKEFKDAANAKEIEDNKKLLEAQNRDEKAALEARNRDEKAALEARLLQIQNDFEAEMEVKALLAEIERDIALQNAELTENEKLLIREKYNSDIRALEKETSDKNIELAKQEREQLGQIYNQGLTALNAVTDAVFANKLARVEKGSKAELEIQKKQFKMNKALQLSAAVIDGFKAISASLALSPIAIGAVPNPAGIASLAFAAATSAANVAKIAATRFDGGNVTPPDVQAPNIASPNIGAPELPQGTSTSTSNLINRPNKVVVVDSEIKAVMNQSEQIEVVSSFG